ncbi:MAG: endolytic transglycosylase MltG [Chitinophagaceae bacterium]
MKKTILVIVVLSLLFFGVRYYMSFFGSNMNIEKSVSLYIPSQANWQQLMDSMQHNNFLKNEASFVRVAEKMGLKNNIHPGRYIIEKGMSNYALAKKIRSGKQDPIKLVLNKLRTKKDIIQKLSSKLEPSAQDFSALFSSADWLQKMGIDSNQVQCVIIPNTYEVYWNTDAEHVLEKITKSYFQYWNDERKNKAKALQLTPMQVCTIASIVEEETNKNDEKPKIASVYLNRYKIGMKLGADPTVKFAVGDFALKRILTKHTQTPSPYNTYLVQGLPPGPICTPNKSSIEAVLNPDQTNYLFFCAKEDFSGYHNFAENYSQHQANAKRYHQALNERNIK